jgi:hypothetical protein
MIPLLDQWLGHCGAAHRKNMTLHPSEGVALRQQGCLLATSLKHNGIAKLGG